MSSEDRIINIKAAEFISFDLPLVLNQMADFLTENKLKITDTWDVTVENVCGTGKYVGVIYYLESPENNE